MEVPLDTLTQTSPFEDTGRPVSHLSPFGKSKTSSRTDAGDSPIPTACGSGACRSMPRVACMSSYGAGCCATIRITSRRVSRNSTRPAISVSRRSSARDRTHGRGLSDHVGILLMPALPRRGLAGYLGASGGVAAMPLNSSDGMHAGNVPAGERRAPGRRRKAASMRSVSGAAAQRVRPMRTWGKCAAH